jgi:serine protease Do
MKSLRFWSLATLLGVTVLAAVAWLGPVAHGQAARTPPVVVTEPGVEKIVAAQVGGPEVRRFEMLLGDRGSRIGLSIRDLADADLAAGKSGVLVEDVRADSPAAAAGLKNGDIVTSFDGERVRSARQLARLVEETPSGRSVKAEVLRDGKPVALNVVPTVDDRSAGLMRNFDTHRGGDHQAFKWVMPEVPDIARELGNESFDVSIWARPGRLGVSVQSLTPDLAQYFGVKDGVLVTAVTKDSAASKAGIKAGDVITSVDGKPVDDAGELRRHLRADEDESMEVTLGVTRDRKPLSLRVPLEGRAKPQAKRPGRAV